MSSATQSPGSGETAIIFVVLLVFFVLRRVYRSYRGIRFSSASTIGVLIFYVVFGSFFSISSFFEGVSPLYAAPYAVVLAASALWSYRFSDKRISFWKGGDGQVYFKGGVLLYLVYVLALVTRISINLIVIGPSFLTLAPGVALSPSALGATIATDLLLMFGLGLLIGRNVRVLKRYRLIKEGKEELTDPPPDYQPIFRRRSDPSGQ